MAVGPDTGCLPAGRYLEMTMEKEILIKCVPAEMLERLKKLAKKLWDDSNPVSVRLNAIFDEFEQETQSLANMVEEYEAEYSARLESAKKGYAEKILYSEQKVSDLKVRLAELEKERGENKKKTAELESVLRRKETELDAIKVSASEGEGELNSRFVAKMHELYDKSNKKELEMYARWEEKNKAFDAKGQEFEGDYAARSKQLKLRERALEEDFNARKGELIKTFDRIRVGLEAREKELSAREKGQPGKSGAL